MFAYINALLSQKNEKYKESRNKKNFEKSKTREYFNSFIIFIYDHNNKENVSFLNVLSNFDSQQFVINLLPNKRKTTIKKYFSGNLFSKEQEKLNRYNTNQIFEKEKSLFPNIKVITSDICGLGKTYLIKKMIEKKEEKYFNFLLGGKITKAVIFNQFSSLLKKIKKEIK